MKILRRIILFLMVLSIASLTLLMHRPSVRVNESATSNGIVASPTQKPEATTELPSPTPTKPSEQPLPTPAKPSEQPTPTPIEPTEKPKNKQKSILDFLKIAIQPVGSTMYVWGGGWNKEDTGAGIDAVTLGISPTWEAFVMQQDASYNYKNFLYQIHNGLDCSGYIGWAVYNTLENENGKEGYVFLGAEMAQKFAEKGFGEFIPTANISRWQAGDIMSMKGHVWISLGTCEDGSVLMLHSSPPGVIFCGTNLADGSKSQAVALAEQIMSTHYPHWYAKYPNCARSITYLTESSAMRWSRQVLSDDEKLTEMDAVQVAATLF